MAEEGWIKTRRCSVSDKMDSEKDQEDGAFAIPPRQRPIHRNLPTLHQKISYTR